MFEVKDLYQIKGKKIRHISKKDQKIDVEMFGWKEDISEILN